MTHTTCLSVVPGVKIQKTNQFMNNSPLVCDTEHHYITQKSFESKTIS